MKNLVSTSCLIGAIVAVALFLGPGFRVSMENDGSGQRAETVHSMGLPSSPWWEYRKVEVDDMTTHASFEVRLGSLSWLALIAAFVLYRAWHKMTASSTPPVQPP